MNKIQDLLGEAPTKLALLLYLAAGLLQLWVIPSGMEAWFGVHWMLAVIVAALLAWIPVLGQAAALAAAVDVLGWPVPLAAALFLWPLWFTGVVLGLRRLAAARGGRGEAAEAGGAENDVELFRRRIGGLTKGRPRAEPSPSAPSAPDHGLPTERPPAEAV